MWLACPPGVNQTLDAPIFCHVTASAEWFATRDLIGYLLDSSGSMRQGAHTQFSVPLVVLGMPVNGLSPASGTDCLGSSLCYVRSVPCFEPLR